MAARLSEEAGQHSRALSHQGNRSRALQKLHRWDEVKTTYARILDTRRLLAQGDPDAYLPDVATTLNNLGALLADLGEREAPRQNYEESVGIYWNFFQRFPAAFHRNLVMALNGLRRVHEALGNNEEEKQCRELIGKLVRGEAPGGVEPG